MDLMTRPLTRKEVSDMVENDEIPFKVRIDKILALSCKNDESDDAVFDFSNEVSQLVLGNTDGTVTDFGDRRNFKCCTFPIWLYGWQRND